MLLLMVKLYQNKNKMQAISSKKHFKKTQNKKAVKTAL